MDNLTPAQRSRRMSAVRQKNTGPELQLRRLLHREGYRYRLHERSLPGTPDIVFPSRKKAIFVNGCFWHGHDCRAGRPPSSNTEFWKEKIARNTSRDAVKLADLEALGWASLIVWQCELKRVDKILDRVSSFLAPNS